MKLTIRLTDGKEIQREAKAMDIQYQAGVPLSEFMSVVIDSKTTLVRRSEITYIILE